MQKIEKQKLLKALDLLFDSDNPDGFTEATNILIELAGKKAGQFERIVSGEIGGIKMQPTDIWIEDIAKLFYENMKKLYIEITDIERNKKAMDRPFIITVIELIKKYDSQFSR